MLQRLVVALRRGRPALLVAWTGAAVLLVGAAGALLAGLSEVARPGVLGGLAGMAAAALLALGVVLWVGRPRIPRRVVLEIDLEPGVVEQVPDDPLARLAFGRLPELHRVVRALEVAAEDRRVVGVLARLGSSRRLGLAQIQELREAVLRFRRHGKPAVAFAETFGELGPGDGAYYLATAFSEVYLQPSGDLGLTGLVYQHPFLAGVLERLGVRALLDRRRDYKTAVNLFTERAYTEHHRRALEGVLRSQFDQMVAAIARDRRLEEGRVRALIDRGPLSAGEALEAGLVDGSSYRDEVVDRLTGEAERMPLVAYEALVRPPRRAETVALVFGVGGVVRGRSRIDPRFRGTAMGSDTVTSALREAVEARRVKAIVFRIDSPGGSYVASDAIRREVARAREAGKPVVVSMGDLAGSGGYFVAMEADRIVAQPATVTGSIGVAGGKFDTSRLWERLGLTWDEVHEGEHATMWSPLRGYRPGEWERLQAWLDRVYADFTERVGAARGLAPERVEEVSGGRIWSGEQARRLGLVDELGGLETAVASARQLAGIPAHRPVRLEVLPGRRPLLDRLVGDRRPGGDPGRLLRLVLESDGPLAPMGGEMALLAPHGW